MSGRTGVLAVGALLLGILGLAAALTGSENAGSALAVLGLTALTATVISSAGDRRG